MANDAETLLETWKKQPPAEAPFEEVEKVVRFYLGDFVSEGKRGSHLLKIGGNILQVLIGLRDEHDISELSCLKFPVITIPASDGASKVKGIYIKQILAVIKYKPLYDKKIL